MVQVLEVLLEGVRSACAAFPDKRRGRDVTYAMADKRARKRFFEHIGTITADRVRPDGQTLMQTLIDSKPPPGIAAQVAISTHTDGGLLELLWRLPSTGHGRGSLT